MSQLQDLLRQAFDSEALDEARVLTAQLQYLYRIYDEIVIQTPVQ